MRPQQAAGDGPDANLAANTTEHLVADIERLREHLGVKRWVVVGVSWGVTLGLVYAQRHRDRVLAMVLAAVTSGTRRETDWITREMGRVFPREWERFRDVLPEPDREGDLAAGYARLLADTDSRVRERAAAEWCAWEDTHVSLVPGWTPSVRYEDAAFRSVFARLVTPLVPREFPRTRSGGGRGGPARRDSGRAHSRAIRRVQPPRHRLAPTPVLARQSSRGAGRCGSRRWRLHARDDGRPRRLPVAALTCGTDRSGQERARCGYLRIRRYSSEDLICRVGVAPVLPHLDGLAVADVEQLDALIVEGLAVPLRRRSLDDHAPWSLTRTSLMETRKLPWVCSIVRPKKPSTSSTPR